MGCRVVVSDRAAMEVARILSTPAAREVVPTDPRLSARWLMHGAPGLYSRWNYHPEFEIHLVRYGCGYFVVGDRIDTFAAGQLVLIGPNLPHHWISDLQPGEAIRDRDVVFQFHHQWVQQCQAVLPELMDIEPLLKKSARGVEFSGNTSRRGAEELELIGLATGSRRLQHIFALFSILVAAPNDEYHPLTESTFSPIHDDHAADLIDRVLSYIMDNLVRDVRLSVAAEHVAMSESAFSRYFKRVTGHTFSDTVAQLRLAHVCKLLCDTDLPVSSIARRVGYSNISNFNRRFRAKNGCTPSEFRRNHHQ